jgi:hypothetical protein
MIIIIIISFLFHYKIMTNYKCTFDLKESKNTSVKQKQMPNAWLQERVNSTGVLFTYL